MTKCLLCGITLPEMMPSVQGQSRVLISKVEEEFLINESPMQYYLVVRLGSLGHLRKRKFFQRKIYTHPYVEGFKMPPTHGIENALTHINHRRLGEIWRLSRAMEFLRCPVES